MILISFARNSQASVAVRKRTATLKPMKFVCQLHEQNGTWTGEHASANVGPVSVTAPTRGEALRKLEAEIRYWLEMCPCTGQTYQHIDIEVVESGRNG